MGKKDKHTWESSVQSDSATKGSSAHWKFHENPNLTQQKWAHSRILFCLNFCSLGTRKQEAGKFSNNHPPERKRLQTQVLLQKSAIFLLLTCDDEQMWQQLFAKEEYKNLCLNNCGSSRNVLSPDQLAWLLAGSPTHTIAPSPQKESSKMFHMLEHLWLPLQLWCLRAC